MFSDSSFTYYAYGAGIPLGSLVSSEAKNFEVSHSSFLPSLFQMTVHTSASPNKKLDSPSLDQKEVTSQIETTLDYLQGLKEKLQNIRHDLESSSSTQAMIAVTQMWIADIILKKGAKAAKSGLHVILPSDSLPALGPVTECIKAISDLIDPLAGAIGYMYQARLLQAALQEISKLKQHSHELNPEQQLCLSQLEGQVKYAQSLLPSKEFELILKNMRNVFSYFTFALSWATHNPLAKVLSSGAQIVIGGINLALQGVSFYRARQKLNLVHTWSKDFEIWVKEKIVVTEETLKKTFEAEKVKEAIDSPIRLFLKKREKNQQIQIQNLKEKIERKDLSMTVIQERIKEFKTEGLLSFLNRLNVKDLSHHTLADQLNEKLGIDVNPLLVQSIRTAYMDLDVIKRSEILSSEEKQKAIDTIQVALSQTVKECIAAWMEKQSKDSLLNLYVDYHATVDLTVKNALTSIVQKQHQVNKDLLNIEKNVIGIKFTASSVIFAVTLALFILGLLSVATPVGLVALISTMLTVTSIGVSAGLTVAGYYYASSYQPALTAATLKGIYFRLFYYKIGTLFHILKERTEDYLKIAKRNKIDQLAALAGHFHLFHLSSAQDLQAPNKVRTAIAQTEGDFRNIKSKAQEWKEKAENLQAELDQMEWADFAQQADLKIAKQDSQSPLDSFDTLQAFNDALVHSNFNLLSPETKELLEKQLGINIHSLQLEIEKNPLAIKNLLQKFFTLEEGDFIKFIGQQGYLK